MNWVKLRVWELEDEFDALLVIDADTTVVGDVSGVFALPTDFAATLDMDKSAGRWAAPLHVWKG